MTENYWSRSDFPREPGVLGKPLVDPANWYPDEILSNRKWIYRLSQTEISEVEKAVRHIKVRGLEIKNITSKGYSFFMETIYLLNLTENNIKQIPIRFKDRAEGNSKIPKVEIN